MKLIKAFMRLIRWPNLLFIVLTQCLFYYCAYLPLLPQPAGLSSHLLFCLLSVSSVLIAAAGYIINDYFDIQIDSINKPERMVIGRYIKRRWAIIWHWLLSGIGLLISVYISWKTGAKLILPVNFLCVLLLWFYSVNFKKKLLSGNIIIALLTAWVVWVVYVFVGGSLLSLKGWDNMPEGFNIQKFFKFTVLYGGFAFIMTIIREVIKDLEDMEGDRKYDCRTMPIAWGVPATKVFTAVWIVVCTGALVIVQVYSWQSGWWIAAFYNLVFIICPLILLLRNLYRANTAADYHRLSNWVKLIMLAGILSMLLIKIQG